MSKVYRRVTTSILAAAIALVPASAAFGHASGMLPHARLSADEQQVFIQWTAAGDDVADIGVGLGLLPKAASMAYQGIGDSYPTTGQVRSFARSDELHAYVLDNVHVTQHGEPCDPEVEIADDVIAEGVRFVFTCPAEVEHAHVRITMLHDRDELYRTYSIDGTIQDAVHTVDDPEHLWDFTVAGRRDRSGGQLLLLGGIGVALSGVAGVLRRISATKRRSKVRS